MALSFFLVCFSSVICLVAGQVTQYELKGHRVTLKPGITGQPEEILWKHNGNKVVEFDGKEESVFGSYENRINLNWHSAEVNISDLGFEDSGHYELELFMNKNLYRSYYVLEVIDKVAKPKISCEMNNGSDSDTLGTLDCSAESRRSQPMSFEWSSHGNVQHGPQLTISLGDSHDDELYTCNVSNPLSFETATFTAKDCYPGKNSSVALIASMVIIFIFIIVTVLGVLYWKWRHKERKMDAQDETPQKGCDMAAQDETPKKGSCKETTQDDENNPLLPENQKTDTPQPHGHQESPNTRKETESAPAEDDRNGFIQSINPERKMDAQDETPQKGCDMAAQDETPKKGIVRERRRIFDPNHREQTIEDEQNKDEHEKTPSPPCTLHSEPPSPDHSDLVSNNKANSKPAGASGSVSEDSTSSTAPQYPAPEKEADEDEEAKSPSAKGVSPPAQPPVVPEDAANEHKEEANLDQDNGETA